MDTLFWVAVGAVIGWHVPQPIWAKLAIDKIKSMFTAKAE